MALEESDLLLRLSLDDRPRTNSKSLSDYLKKLQGSRGGDVAFLLPSGKTAADSAKIGDDEGHSEEYVLEGTKGPQKFWAHSALFCIAARGLPVSEFGHVEGTEQNKSGKKVPVIKVSEEKRKDFVVAMNKCYTEKNMDELCAAIGGGTWLNDVEVCGQAGILQMNMPLDQSLPQVSRPDFKILLVGEADAKEGVKVGMGVEGSGKEPKIVSPAKNKRFVGKKQIPLGKKQAIREPKGIVDELEKKKAKRVSEPAKPQAIMTLPVHRFLLEERIPYYTRMFSSNFFDAGSDHSILHTDEFTKFSLAVIGWFLYHKDANALLYSFPNVKPYIENAEACCDRPAKDTPQPPLDVIDKLVQVLQAADYLDFSAVKYWAEHSLKSMLHMNAKCKAGMCTKFVIHFLEFAIKDNQERFLGGVFYKSCMRRLASSENILTMWKRPLLSCSEELLTSLRDTMREETIPEDDILDYYWRLSKLRSLTKPSPRADEWDLKLILPAMDICAEVAADYDESIAATDFKCEMAKVLDVKSNSFKKPIAEELLTKMARKINKANCRNLFEFLSSLENCVIVEQQKEVVKWFQKNWANLVMEPAMYSNVEDQCFFDEWGEESLQALAEDLGVGITELWSPQMRKWKENLERTMRWRRVVGYRKSTRNEEEEF